MGISNFAFNMLLLIALVIGGEWFFYVGVRVYLNELLALIFVVICFIFNKTLLSAPVPRVINRYIKLSIYTLLFAALTGLLVPWEPVSAIPDSATYYFKAIAQLILHVTFVICAARFLLLFDYAKVRSVMNFYIYGTISCTIYGIVQGVIYSYLHIDIDAYIWSFFFMDWDPTTGIERYAWGAFYRIKGWSQEPNVLASYIASIFSVVLLSKMRVKWISSTILSAGLLMTQSLSGIGGVILSSVSLVRKQTTIIKVFIPAALILAGSFIGFRHLYTEEVDNFIYAKLDPQGTRLAHFDLIRDAFDAFADNPIGYGFGTSSQVIEFRTGIPGYNFHSSWMTYLVEQGPVGLLLNIWLSLIVLFPLLQVKNTYLNACGAGYLAMLIGATFYNNLNIFYAQLFPALALVLYVNEARESKAIGKL